MAVRAESLHISTPFFRQPPTTLSPLMSFRLALDRISHSRTPWQVIGEPGTLSFIHSLNLVLSHPLQPCPQRHRVRRNASWVNTAGQWEDCVWGTWLATQADSSSSECIMTTAAAAYGEGKNSVWSGGQWEHPRRTVEVESEKEPGRTLSVLSVRFHPPESVTADLTLDSPRPSPSTLKHQTLDLQILCCFFQSIYSILQPL